MNQRAVVFALLAAALFGISTPAAKVLVGAIDPIVLAGLPYCGAGLGVAVLRRVLRARSAHVPEATLTRNDLPALAGSIISGGIIAPLLLMVGLTYTDAAAASLLLTLEGVATAVLAWFVFHEGFDRRIALGMVCLVAGALLLAWSGVPTFAGVIGPLAISGACLA